MTDFKPGESIRVILEDDNSVDGKFIRDVDENFVEIEIFNYNSLIISRSSIVSIENKFKVGDAISYYDDGRWYDDGIVTHYSTNFLKKKLVHIKSLTFPERELIFYESEVRLRRT
jgi:hypothetical protein